MPSDLMTSIWLVLLLHIPRRGGGRTAPSWLLASICLLGVGLGPLGCGDDGSSAGGSSDTGIDLADDGEVPPFACVAGCGDATCDPSLEDCETCIIDCGDEECSGTALFAPGSTAIALGSVFEPRCGDDVYTANPQRGLSDGAEALPFKQGTRTLLTEHPPCGGVGTDGESKAATGVDLRDGSFGMTFHCLSIGDKSKSVPVEVGLRYEVGRWREPDPERPGWYERPGSLHAAPFWFTSYSRRLHGDFPPWEPGPWPAEALPDDFTLVMEDYTAYRFERDSDTRRYLQPGTTANSAVAFAEIIERETTECSSAGDPSRFIADNDIMVHYPDGTHDVFSGRDLTLEGHVDNDQNHLVITHGRRDPEGAATCGGSVGIKRIASYPVDADQPLFWVELEHEYREWTSPIAPEATLGIWQLTRIVDSVGRQMVVGYEAEAPDRITELVAFPGRPEQQAYRFGYDELGVMNELELPAPSADPDNRVSMVHEHPSDRQQGGLSRVLQQSRRIGGHSGQTTTFEWSDHSDYDLFITLPDGTSRRIAHQSPQGGQLESLWAAGRNDNRVTAVYGLDATSNPRRSVYDPDTGVLTEECDALSSGPSGLPSEPGPRCTGYEYDDQLRLVAEVKRNEAGDAVRTQMEYESFAPGNDHRLSRVIGPTGDETTYRYQTQPWMDDSLSTIHLVELRDPVGSTTTFSWCSGTATCPRGQLATMTTALGGTTTQVYDPEYGSLSIIRFDNGVQERIGYDIRGCITRSDDEHGLTTVYVYPEGHGDCLPTQQLSNPEGPSADRIVTRFEYDPARQLVARIFDEGGETPSADTVYAYDNQVITTSGRVGPVLERLAGNPSGEFLSEQAFHYNVHGKLERTDDLLMDRSTTIEHIYDLDGSTRITTRRSGITGGATEHYDAAGLLVDSRDELGVGTHYTYSEQSGRTLTEEYGSGPNTLLTTYIWTDDGLPHLVTAGADVIAHDYDPARRRIALMTNDVLEQIERDAEGRSVVERTTLSTGEVEELRLDYEGAGEAARLKAMTLSRDDQQERVVNHFRSESMPWGACQANQPGDCYDPVQIDSPREVDGATTHRLVTHDGLGRVRSVTELASGNGDSTEFNYEYDSLDCLRMISGAGRTQTFECDRQGRTTVETAWGTKTRSYYPDGQVRSVTDFNGTVTRYWLDPAGWRVGLVTYDNEPADVVEVEDVTFDYYANDLVATMTDGEGVTEYHYDGLNRIVARTRTSNSSPTPRTLGYTYDPETGQLDSQEYWGQGSVEYGYDEQRRLSSITAFGSPTIHYGYADDGHLLTETGPISTVHTYDPMRRLDALVTTAGGTPGAGSNLLTLEYNAPGFPAWDANGNLGGVRETWLQEDPLTHVFDAYDEADRLLNYEHPALDPALWTDDGDAVDEQGEPIELLGELFDANEYDLRGNATRFMGTELSYDEDDWITTEDFFYDVNGNITCIDRDGTCHCTNGIVDQDETGIDCGGADCGCCPSLDDLPPPPFVGTTCPADGPGVDWAAMELERLSYHDPGELSFGFTIPYDPAGGCGSVTYELPVPCDGYVDYEMFRMGGAIATLMFPPHLPVDDNWVHNPGYVAEGLMDPFYMHPAKSGIPECLGPGGMCAIGSYGNGLSNNSQEPCDLARSSLAPAPTQPVLTAYNDRVRAFPVYTRGTPDLQYPPGFQECYDRIDFHAQAGVVGTCQNDGYDHGRIYVVMRANGHCG
ncbi:MAG: hypothetical protein AAGF11_45235 [Myxococcota bacterium]